MSTKVKQALKEFGYAFAAAVVPLFIGFINGFEVDGKTVLPDLSAVRAFFFSAIAAGVLAGIKAIAWYFTGTQVADK